MRDVVDYKTDGVTAAFLLVVVALKYRLINKYQSIFIKRDGIYRLQLDKSQWFVKRSPKVRHCCIFWIKTQTNIPVSHCEGWTTVVWWRSAKHYPVHRRRTDGRPRSWHNFRWAPPSAWQNTRWRPSASRHTPGPSGPLPTSEYDSLHDGRQNTSCDQPRVASELGCQCLVYKILEQIENAHRRALEKIVKKKKSYSTPRPNDN